MHERIFSNRLLLKPSYCFQYCSLEISVGMKGGGGALSSPQTLSLPLGKLCDPKLDKTWAATMLTQTQTDVKFTENTQLHSKEEF